MLASMFRFVRRACVLLALSIFGSLAVQAKGLISLKSEPLSAAQAAAVISAPATVNQPRLEGAAAGSTPLSLISHYDSVWMLARGPGGALAWLEHAKATGWRLRAAPPAGLRSELQPGGQAHLLAIATPETITTPETREAVVYTYSAITDTWATVGRTTLAGRLTALHPAQGGFVLTTISPDGKEQLNHLTVILTKRLLSWIDWAIIVLYLVVTAAIGFYYYARQHKTNNEDFFLGGRAIPWWAAGVSLYATGTSAISYIAIPAKSFATNWLYLAGSFMSMVGTIFVALWVVPLIRRLNLMSVYHYLEMRFHPKLRLVASALAIVMQLGGRMSMVLFLPSLAVSAVTGVNVTHSILIMGAVTILYTVMGGMRAVIWTDFIQVIVMLGGAFVAIGFIIFHVEGGVGEFFRIAVANDKFETFDWSFDLTKATVWGFLLVAVMGVLTYPQDQVMMQRVLATKSDKEAGWSIWTLAVIVIPGNLTFFAIGTALYVFYRQHPASLNPMLSVDSTFPQFIAAELPVGLTGLIIAGIFAASMSTLSGTMNSVATLVSVDFYERYSRNFTQAKSVRLAEIMTVVGGVIGIGTALALASINMTSALDTWFELTGLLGGGFAGCYALGMFTRRANWQGAIIGVAASIVLTFAAWSIRLVHPYFYLPVAITICIVFGYAASYCFPAPHQSLRGLTVYTPHQTPIILSTQ